MLRLVLLLFGSFRAALHSRADLVIENLAPRQQLAVLAHTGRRGRVTGADRLFWVTLRRLWARWSDVLVFVKPETVIQWHRAGFRRYWTCLSRRQRTGRPSINSGLRELILRLLAENPTWGAPRIHDELLMLGLSISERTVFKVSPSPAATLRCARALDAVSPQPPRRDRGDGLLHCSDRKLPNPLCLVRDRSRQEARSPF